MFGALNRFISRLDAEPEDQKTGPSGAAGFQVLRNTNLELAVEPWFDFIIGINGRTIVRKTTKMYLCNSTKSLAQDNPDPTLFATEVRNCAGSTISLGVWSAKVSKKPDFKLQAGIDGLQGQRIREIYVAVPSDPPSLGLSLQWSLLSGTDDVWHILDVTPNSPADLAGLLPYGDYVIGSPEGLVRGESGLSELVEDVCSPCCFAHTLFAPLLPRTGGASLDRAFLMPNTTALRITKHAGHSDMVMRWKAMLTLTSI